MNENYIDIELGGWNIPEAITGSMPVMVGIAAGEWTRFHLKGGE